MTVWGRRKRERRIRQALATFPNTQAYPSEIAEMLGLPPNQVWADMRRMAGRQRGVRVVPGHARYLDD